MEHPRLNPISLFLKGAAMGAANVIPGVSGGTIAFVTGIYESLIASLKSFDHHALAHLLKFRLAKFADHVNLRFLAPLLLGVAISVLTLAKVLLWLFDKHPVLTWSFFFGLIVASVLIVGRSIKRWSPGVVVALLAGTAIATGVALTTPAQENGNFLYLVLCGAVAFSSMIVPGLSGSFVLVLMGNYFLVLNGISDFTSALNPFDPSAIAEVFLAILLPVGIGVAIGFVSFSHLLDWLFKHFHDATVALLTGFILGSLLIIWPWKKEITESVAGKSKTVGYEWLPAPLDQPLTYAAFAVIAAGFLAVWLIERAGADKPASASPSDPDQQKPNAES